MTVRDLYRDREIFSTDLGGEEFVVETIGERLSLNTYTKSGDLEGYTSDPEAVARLREALNEHAERNEAHVEIGGVRMTQEQFDAATFAYRQGEAPSPAVPDWRVLGHTTEGGTVYVAPATVSAPVTSQGYLGTFEHTDAEGDRVRIFEDSSDEAQVIVETRREEDGVYTSVRVPIRALLDDMQRRAESPLKVPVRGAVEFTFSPIEETEADGLAQWERDLLTATEAPEPDPAAPFEKAISGLLAGLQRADDYARGHLDGFRAGVTAAQSAVSNLKENA